MMNLEKYGINRDEFKGLEESDYISVFKGSYKRDGGLVAVYTTEMIPGKYIKNPKLNDGLDYVNVKYYNIINDCIQYDRLMVYHYNRSYYQSIRYKVIDVTYCKYASVSNFDRFGITRDSYHEKRHNRNELLKQKKLYLYNISPLCPDTIKIVHGFLGWDISYIHNCRNGYFVIKTPPEN